MPLQGYMIWDLGTLLLDLSHFLVILFWLL